MARGKASSGICGDTCAMLDERALPRPTFLRLDWARERAFAVGVGACTAGVLAFLLVQLTAWPPRVGLVGARRVPHGRQPPVRSDGARIAGALRPPGPPKPPARSRNRLRDRRAARDSVLAERRRPCGPLRRRGRSGGSEARQPG